MPLAFKIKKQRNFYQSHHKRAVHVPRDGLFLSHPPATPWRSFMPIFLNCLPYNQIKDFLIASARICGILHSILLFSLESKHESACYYCLELYTQRQCIICNLEDSPRISNKLGMGIRTTQTRVTIKKELSKIQDRPHCFPSSKWPHPSSKKDSIHNSSIQSNIIRQYFFSLKRRRQVPQMLSKLIILKQSFMKKIKELYNVSQFLLLQLFLSKTLFNSNNELNNIQLCRALCITGILETFCLILIITISLNVGDNLPHSTIFYFLSQMDPENYKLRNYTQLPLIPANDFQELVKTRHLVLHYNLVVGYEGFNHPGYFNTIEQFRGKQIQDAYIQREHSFNSDLILCHKTIGRLDQSPLEEQGCSFYNKIKDSDLNIRHQEILSKFDFSQPIYESMKHLTFEEINTLTEIPKFFKNPYSVKIAKDGEVTPKGWIGIETESMLESNMYFGSYMVVALGFLFYNYTLMDILKNSYFTIIGYVFWCFLEYIIHRYRLHHNMLQTHMVKGGDMHHIFPNHPGNLSIGDVNPYIPIMLSPLYFILSPVQLTLIVVGVISGLLFYNIIHYSCHLGPEVNIGWFRALRTHHLRHHFRDQHSRYGISATIWDHVFGTMTSKEKSK